MPKLLDYLYAFTKISFLYNFIVFQIPTYIYIIVFLFNLNFYFIFKKRSFCLLLNLFICLFFSTLDLLSSLFLFLLLLFWLEFSIFTLILKENYIYNISYSKTF